MSLWEHALAYETHLTWEHTSDSGYAVVVRGARGQLGTGSSKDFTADNEYTLLVPVGGEVAVAVHPDMPDPPSTASVPGIIPGSGTTTLVATA